LPSYWALKAMIVPSREDGVGFDAGVRGQSPGVLAVDVGDPEVFLVDERNIFRADGRLGQESGIGPVLGGGGPGRDDGGEYDQAAKRPHGSNP
jgi:hypothetical protein